MMNVGPGIIEKMVQNNDRPLTPSYYEHFDEDGNPYVRGPVTVEKCWGTKGLYIASNVSGSWSVQGPFGQNR